MKLKNKIFLIFTIFLCVVSSFITFSDASYDVEFEGVKYTLPDFPGDDNTFKLVFFDSKIKYAYLYTSKEAITYGNFNEGYVIFPEHKEYSCRLNSENPKFSFDGDYPSSSSTSEKFKIILYSNYDVYDKNGKLVFQKAPPAQMVTPMEVSKVEELPTLIIQIVEMIIPVFLIIFGTLLVLYLIKSKNLLQL